MAFERKLIDYLPPYMQEYHEINRIMDAEQPEFEDLWGACETVLDDQFILYAKESGVKRWEKLMSITPKDTDTLDDRKFRILAKMNQELPYTMKRLKESLTILCGKGNFSIDLQAVNYHIEVKLALANKNAYEETIDLLKKMLPANLTQSVQIMYNDHIVLSQLTHAQLASYTHHQLRNEVLI
jgi:hypothetical protein